MLIIKPGVELTGLRPEMLLGVCVVHSIFESEPGYGPCVITSVMDGRHSDKSLHYAGQAVDFRTRHLFEDQRRELLTKVRDGLTTQEFDALLEPDHLHVEFQPSRRSP